MDAATAQTLLKQIHQTKQASQFQGLAGMLPNINLGAGAESPGLQLAQNQRLQSDAKKDIVRNLVMALGGGAALRGAVGLHSMVTEPARIKPTQRVVEMPVAYPADEEEKRSRDATATSPLGLSYYAPGMLLGGAVAGYGGWKGVDALLDRQRRKQTDEELDSAKQEYEQALLGAYKKATDSALDQAFAGYTKSAGLGQFLEDSVSTVAPNAPGMAKGLGLTYGLATAPLGFMMVNNMLKKNSKRALLQKAMQERARRQALTQPPEIYAVPRPQEEESA